MRLIAFFLIFTIHIVEAKQDRRPFPPFITGDGFRDSCDFILDDTLCTLAPEKVKEGNTIFLKTDFLLVFFELFHPFIQNKYILVSHNGDLPIPGKFSEYLDDPKLIAWFGQNVENFTHPKLHPIPIGLENRYNSHGDLSLLAKLKEEHKNAPKLFQLYCNFSLSSFPERRQAFNYLKNLPFCTLSKPKPYTQYLIDLAHSTFIISPRGYGLDSHRTWEALYMGSIPIVKTSDSQKMFDDLPVVLVNDWEDVTSEFLSGAIEKISQGHYNLQKLELEYWLNKIEQEKKRHLSQLK